MTRLPAVCPVCARVHELDPRTLPESLSCGGCGATLRPCAHGAAVVLEAQREGNQAGLSPENPEVEDLLARAEKERKPDRAYAHILLALETDPDSFAANRALLYHGKLHEAVRRPGDYSVIKSYLLHMFEEPESYTPEQREARLEELFCDPQLMRTAALSGDGSTFLREYIQRLANEYMTIFVRGRSSVSRGVFGFSRSSDSVRERCAEIVAVMERNIQAEPGITAEQCGLLSEALTKGLGA